MNWHNFENKRILGTVPVEPDGSVYFECPSDRFVYFQLLDANGMMIQSMRSGTIIQSGEQQGCTGCHEDRNESIPLQRGGMPLALKRPPSPLNGWNGPPRTFSYQAEIQPILDRHCVSCHDYGKPAGEGLNLAGDRTLVFNTSYTDLWSLGFLECIGGGPAETQARPLVGIPPQQTHHDPPRGPPRSQGREAHCRRTRPPHHLGRSQRALLPDHRERLARMVSPDAPRSPPARSINSPNSPAPGSSPPTAADNAPNSASSAPNSAAASRNSTSSPSHTNRRST